MKGLFSVVGWAVGMLGTALLVVGTWSAWGLYGAPIWRSGSPPWFAGITTMDLGIVEIPEPWCWVVTIGGGGALLALGIGLAVRGGRSIGNSNQGKER